MSAPTENDLSLTSQPVCPFCGHEERDAWEMDFGGMEGSCKHTCASCGEEYKCWREVTIYYSTEKIKETP